MPAEVDDLQQILDELDRRIRVEQPDLLPRLRPGLSARQVEELARALLPYHLPAELVALYRWHDGWEDYRDGEVRSLLPDTGFNSLAESIEAYEVWLQALGSNGWHPLWFPAFGTQSGELVSLQLEPGQSAGPVFAFHSHTDLETSYDSVTTLFATALELWSTGELPQDDPARLPPGLQAIRARHNPHSRGSDGLPREEISRSSTNEWPALWKAVVGISAMAPAGDDEVITIAEFVANPACGRPIRGEVRGWGGSGDSLIVSASDPTGTVRLLLTREGTENFREVKGGALFDLWLVPLTDRDPLDQLTDAMQGVADVPVVRYFASRVVPI